MEKKKGLRLDTQIISNPLVNIRTEFEYLHKALKAACVFTGETVNYIVIANNAVYLCWGEIEREKHEKLGFDSVQFDFDKDSYKSVAREIESIVKFTLSGRDEDVEQIDKYDSYAEECYLGCRITTEFRNDKSMGYNEYYKAFAKIVPSWLTLEK